MSVDPASWVLISVGRRGGRRVSCGDAGLWWRTSAPSSPRNLTRAREIATRMSKPAESVTTAADLLEETASRRGFG